MHNRLWRLVQSQYWTGREESYRFVPVLEFADAFAKSEVGRRRAKTLAVPFDKASTAGKDPLVYTKFALNSESFSLLVATPDLLP